MTCTWEPLFGSSDSAQWDQVSTEDQATALELATSALQMLTLYRVGTCPITIRPSSKPGCGCPWFPYSISSLADGDLGLDAGINYGPLGGGAGFTPYVRDGKWYNNCPCGTEVRPLSEVDIPGPVGYIEEFRINGEIVDLTSGDWRLDNGHLLVWQGEGTSPIPATQDLNKPDTEVGTWSITYSKSHPVTKAGQLAVGQLAIQFAEALKGKGKCKLPQGVTSVVRNGVSFTLQAGLFPNGLTGIEIVDSFILGWAPAGSPLRTAVVFNPRDLGPRRTRPVPTSGGSL